MKSIPNITDAPLQQLTFLLEDGTSFEMTLYYVEMQRGWFITELIYGDFIVRSIRVTNILNMLHQFRNLIPFGLGCVSEEDREPVFIEDFSSGASQLLVLNSDEVDEYQGILSGEV